jgi:hypothetical protein
VKNSLLQIYKEAVTFVILVNFDTKIRWKYIKGYFVQKKKKFAQFLFLTIF